MIRNIFIAFILVLTFSSCFSFRRNNVYASDYLQMNNDEDEYILLDDVKVFALGADIYIEKKD